VTTVKSCKYKIGFSISLKVLPSVRTIVDEINKSMASFGFSEKLDIRNETLAVTLTVDRFLTQTETQTVADMLAASMREKLPELDVRVCAIGIVETHYCPLDLALDTAAP
jgi:hypothetical protein